MGQYKEIEGNLISLAKTFDVVCHGVNCFCIQSGGIAPQMNKAFGTLGFRLEGLSYKGDINKLGQIDWDDTMKPTVVNAYTQYDITGRKNGKIDLDYEALTLCMRKINHIFKGKHIGLPKIGAGLGGGNWKIIKKIIQTELKDMEVTIVIYNK